MTRSIAAELLERGEWPGLYCGIGVCQQCLVHVEGRGVVRACVTPYEPGMVIRTVPGRTTPGAASPGTTA